MTRFDTQFCRAILQRLLLAIGILSVLFASPALAQSAETLTITTSVEPIQQVGANGVHNVQISISGTGMCQNDLSRTRTDVIIAIQRSAVFPGIGNSLQLLRDAATSFIISTDERQERVGLVAFDALAYTVAPPTADRTALQTGIESLEPGSGFALAPAIQHSARQFAIAADESGVARQALVLIISNTDADKSAVQAAERARLQGIRIITIGVGDQVDRNQLSTIASSPKDVITITDSVQLSETLIGLVGAIREPALARDLEIVHTIDTNVVSIDEQSIIGPGRLEGDQIIWNIPAAYENPVTIGYQITPLTSASFTIDRGTDFQYLACETDSVRTSLPGALNVSAIQPTPELVIPTPTVLAVIPEAQRVAAIPESASETNSLWNNVFAEFCRSIDLISLLILIIAAIMAIWIIMQRNRASTSNQTNQTQHDPCRWILRLMWPMLLWLLSSLLPVLVSNVCRAGEVVYFWRIGGIVNSAAGIYASDGRGWSTIEPVSITNDGSCVGCHAVSYSAGRLSAVVGSGTGPIAAIDLEGNRLELPEVIGSFSAWSPDGTRLVVSTDSRQLVVIDTINSSVKPLEGASNDSYSYMMPTWSPDGRTIAFVRGEQSNSSFSMSNRSDIYTIPAEGGIPEPLTGASGLGMSYYPSYSPDGRWIAFTYHNSGTTTYAEPNAEIYIVPATGGERRRLAANDGVNGEPLTGVSNSWPTWSRDGRSLAFTSKRDDEHYDIFTTIIDDNGNSGIAKPLPGAAEDGVFEHTPFWGIARPIDLWPLIVSRWPFLIGFLLIWLMWLLCNRSKPLASSIANLPPLPPAITIPERKPLPKLYNVEPALIIGVGATGRWVATHLKKSLRDSGGGVTPEGMRYLVIDTPIPGNVTVQVAGVALDRNELIELDRQLDKTLSLQAVLADTALNGWVPQVYAGLPLVDTTLRTGTKGRRPFARVGLIDYLRDEARSKTFLDTIDTAINAALEKHARVRIIVVGSLAGGTSGIISDLAFIAKQRAVELVKAYNVEVDDQNQVIVDAYLTTDAAYPPDDNRKVNTAATLRELERFQLDAFVAKHFHYNASPLGASLDGSLTRPLFDRISLYGYPADEYNTPPEKSVYVTIADTITFNLESNVAQQLLANHGSMMAKHATAQQTHQQLVVGSTGSYVFRLPLIDILEIVRAHLSATLVQQFFGTLAPVTDEQRSEAARLAQQIIGSFHVVYDAIAHQRRVPARDIVNFIGTSYDECVSSINSVLAQRLQHMPSMPIVLIEVVFTQVHEQLQGIKKHAENMRANAPTARKLSWVWKVLRSIWLALGFGRANRDEWDFFLTSVDESIHVVQEVSSSWSALRKVIHGHPNSQLIGVNNRVKDQLDQAMKRREELDNITTRKYLWSVPKASDVPNPAESQHQLDLVVYWCELARPQLIEYLKSIYIEFGRPLYDGVPTLSAKFILNVEPTNREVHVATNEEHTEILSKHVTSILAIIDHIADASTRELAVVVKGGDTEQYRYTIADALLTQYDAQQKQPHIGIVQRFWSRVRPQLEDPFDQNLVPTGELSGYAGVPASVLNEVKHSDLRNTLKTIGTLNAPVALTPAPDTGMQQFTTNDSSAMSIILTRDVAPLMHVASIQTVFQVYQDNAARHPQPNVNSTTERAVYRAEALAVEYERRMQHPLLFLPGNVYRRLHHLIVTALEQEETVRRFALAFASGWLVQHPSGTFVELQIPGQATFTLMPHRNLPPGVCDLNVSVLLGITTDPSQASALSVIDGIVAAPSAVLQDTWRRYVVRFHKPSMDVYNAANPTRRLTPPDYHTRSRELHDLARIAALEVKRKTDPTKWDSWIYP
jgi:hypothetical protein